MNGSHDPAAHSPRLDVRPRVLIIDDDEDFLAAADALLSGEGMDVRLANNAKDGLALAASDAPDLILLDIMLPGQDGLDLLEALRRDPETRRIPVIACTALGERASAEMLKTVGFDNVVAKPLSESEVAFILRTHLRAKTPN